MKLTELKCPSCGGPLTISAKNPNIARCEYCDVHLALEWESEQPEQNPKTNYQKPEVLIYEIKNTKEIPDWKRNIIGAVVIMAALVLTLPLVFPKGKEQKARSEAAKEAWLEGKAVSEAEEEEPEVELTGNLGELASAVFGLPAEEIPASDLARIQWLEMKYVDDQTMVGYSFDLPETEGAELTWMAFPRDSDFGQECLCLFTGLKKINLLNSLRQEDLKGLALTSIGGYFHSPLEVAGIVDDPSTVKEIRFLASVENLEGLDQFTNLESIITISSDMTEVDALKHVPSLKSLKLGGFDELSDFSIFGTMDGIEELSLESENLKALNFLSGMKSLRRLEIMEGQILSLDGVQERPELEALTIDSCDELQNMDAVAQLSGLKELSLEVPYGCSEPQLAGLTSLEHLSLSGFSDCSSVESLTQLKSLNLDSCYFSSPPDLSGLTNLKELTYYSFSGTGLSIGFIEKIPSLEKLDLGGISTYDDISGIFNMPGLRELNISGMECEINFDRVAENHTLEKLSMNAVKLYKNVKVSGGGGIIYVDWDDVVLNDHIGFLSRFQGLKHLSIKSNQLTDLSFVTSMAMLETIDLSDNYVTEIRPLAELKHLRQAVCTGNPVSNLNVLGDRVSLIF